ncbi:MAG: hypothetical protein ABJH04_07290 [Cyclobacteriaceae bacterium]
MNEKKSKVSLLNIAQVQSDISTIREFVRNATDANIHHAVNGLVQSGLSYEYSMKVQEVYKKYREIKKIKDTQISFSPGGDGMLFSINTNSFTKDKGLTEQKKEILLKDLLKWAYSNAVENTHQIKVKVPDTSVNREFEILRKHGIYHESEKDIMENLVTKTIDEVKIIEKENKKQASKSKTLYPNLNPNKIDHLPIDHKAEQLIITRKFLYETRALDLEKAYKNAQEKLKTMEMRANKLKTAGLTAESEKVHFAAVNLGGAITKFYRDAQPMTFHQNVIENGNQAGNKVMEKTKKLFHIGFGKETGNAATLLSKAYADLSIKEFGRSGQSFIDSNIKSEAKELISGTFAASSTLFELNYSKTQEIISDLNAALVNNNRQNSLFEEVENKSKANSKAESKDQGQPSLFEQDVDSILKMPDKNIIPKGKAHLLIAEPVFHSEPGGKNKGIDLS